MDEVEVLDAIEVAAKFEHILTMCFVHLLDRQTRRLFFFVVTCKRKKSKS